MRDRGGPLISEAFCGPAERAAAVCSDTRRHRYHTDRDLCEGAAQNAPKLPEQPQVTCSRRLAARSRRGERHGFSNGRDARGAADTAGAGRRRAAPAARRRRDRRGRRFYTKLPAAFFRRFLEAPTTRKAAQSSKAPLRAFIGPVREPRDHDERYYYRDTTAGPAARSVRCLSCRGLLPLLAGRAAGPGTAPRPCSSGSHSRLSSQRREGSATSV